MRGQKWSDNDRDLACKLYAAQLAIYGEADFWANFEEIKEEVHRAVETSERTDRRPKNSVNKGLMGQVVKGSL